MDEVKKNLKVIGLKEEDAMDVKKWRRMTCCGHFSMRRTEERRLLCLVRHSVDCLIKYFLIRRNRAFLNNCSLGLPLIHNHTNNNSGKR